MSVKWREVPERDLSIDGWRALPLWAFSAAAERLALLAPTAKEVKRLAWEDGTEIHYKGEIRARWTSVIGGSTQTWSGNDMETFVDDLDR